MTDASTIDWTVFVLVVGLRLVVPLFIPRFPLPAILAALVIDGVDKSIFAAFTGLPLDNYQSYDKALDIYYLTIAYLSVLRNWRNPFAVGVAAFLWYYRLVGVLLFELTDLRWLLMVFPNTFEYFVIAIEVVRTRWDAARLSRAAFLWTAGLIWVVIKLPQEWWIHVAQLDFTDEFGKLVDAHPWVWGVLAVLAVVLVVVGRRVVRRLPPADWPFTVDADVVAARVGWVPRGSRRGRAEGRRSPRREGRAGGAGHGRPVRVLPADGGAAVRGGARRHGDGARPRGAGAVARAGPSARRRGRRQHRHQRRRDAGVRGVRHRAARGRCRSATCCCSPTWSPSSSPSTTATRPAARRATLVLA